MRGLRRALLVVGALGVAVIAACVWLALSSNHLDSAGIDAAIVGVVIATYIGTGLFAWWRRPGNRVGLLMVLVGFAFSLGTLQTANASLPFTIGISLSTLYLAVAVHMLFAFPDGQITSRLHRRLVAAVYVLSVAVPTAFVLFSPDCGCPAPGGHPDNAFLIVDSPATAQAIDLVGSLLGIGVIASIVVVLVGRWRATSAGGRRAMTPVLWTGALMTLVIAVLLAVDVAANGSGASEVTNLLALATFAALPFAFLTGLVRSRYWRAGALTDVVMGLGKGELREALADAFDDRSVALAYWLPDRREYVDVDGHRVVLPAAGDPLRASTVVETDGRRIGAIVHDSALCDDPDLVRTVGAAAALAMENERLEAELRARVDELEQSRGRLLEAGLAERRRIERNLHDGAQQRLVALSLQLGLVAQQLDRGQPGAARARELLDGARTEARSALEDLRELARGIHPAVLTDRGLGAALEALADRAPLPVEVASVPAERLPDPVEAAAYFVVAESLTNVAKYAAASRAEVRVGRENGTAVVEVRDDGVGGADPSAGSGLRGLADRLAALDGRLEVDSAPGHGTTIRARVPCRPV